VARAFALSLPFLLMALAAEQFTRAQAPAGPVFAAPGAPYVNEQSLPALPYNSAAGNGVNTNAAEVFSTVDPMAARSARPIPDAAVTHRVASPQIFQSAQILARVGNETILAADVVPLAEQALEEKLKEASPEQRAAIPQEQYDKLKWQFTKVLLDQMIEVKIRYADAVANIPKENLPRVKASINESFEKTALKKLMDKHQAATRAELEKKMAAQGQSLDQQRQIYLERSLASGWESQHIKENRETPVSDILGYYQQHIDEFEYPAKARWEELMVDFDRYNSKTEARAAIAKMGNEVLQGADFGTVAKDRSHGPTRFDGGVYDWTTKGSLVSKILDEAIFGLPVGSMSQILEDERGLHIVRVIERVDAGRKPFEEAQVPIRDKLREADQERQRKEFVAKMKQRIPVWTIFDEKSASTGSVAESAGNVPTGR